MHPITLQLQCEDDPSGKARLMKSWEERKKYEESYRRYGGLYEPFIPPVHISNAGQISKPILLFLTQNGFAKVEEIKSWNNRYQFFSYSDTIKPYIFKGTYEHGKCQTTAFSTPFFESGGFYILLGKRILKSIDYTNQYEATPGGVKIKYFALTFTYVLETAKIPGLPKVTQQFQGKARAYLDPDDGKWKLDQFSLADADASEYLTLLVKQYVEYAKKRQEAKVYLDQGVAYFKKDQYELAIENFSKVIVIEPNNARAYFERGYVYTKKGQHDKAIEDYNKAISIDPNKAIIYTIVAMPIITKVNITKLLRITTRRLP